MVLESVYPTISDAVYDRVGMRLDPLKYILVPALLCQLKPRLGIPPSELRPVSLIGEVGVPVLIASGDRDLHTPLDETQWMFDAASEPRRLVVFEGARHEDLLKSDPLRYESEVPGFIEDHLRLNNSSPGQQVPTMPGEKVP